MDTQACDEIFTALVTILKARTVQGKPLSGNPYLVPEIRQGLEAVAKMRGILSYLNALDGL